MVNLCVFLLLGFLVNAADSASTCPCAASQQIEDEIIKHIQIVKRTTAIYSLPVLGLVNFLLEDILDVSVNITANTGNEFSLSVKLQLKYSCTKYSLIDITAKIGIKSTLDYLNGAYTFLPNKNLATVDLTLNSPNLLLSAISKLLFSALRLPVLDILLGALTSCTSNNIINVPFPIGVTECSYDIITTTIQDSTIFSTISFNYGGKTFTLVNDVVTLLEGELQVLTLPQDLINIVIGLIVIPPSQVPVQKCAAITIFPGTAETTLAIELTQAPTCTFSQDSVALELQLTVSLSNEDKIVTVQLTVSVAASVSDNYGLMGLSLDLNTLNIAPVLTSKNFECDCPNLLDLIMEVISDDVLFYLGKCSYKFEGFLRIPTLFNTQGTKTTCSPTEAGCRCAQKKISP